MIYFAGFYSNREKRYIALLIHKGTQGKKINIMTGMPEDK